MRGWERFREHFSKYQSQYTVIGGTATMLLLEDAGLEVRATKDIDIVLCLEVLDPSFAEAFWAFIEAGKYKQREKSDGGREFYRFLEPEDDTYPKMIEIFCRKPDALKLNDGQNITRLPQGDAAASLSAILLDDDYYAFMRTHTVLQEGVPVADAYGLIALKSYAWVRLTQAKEAGDKEAKGDDIKKHCNDVFRLHQLVEPQVRIEAPEKVRENLRIFLDKLDPDKDLKQLKLGDLTVAKVVEDLTAIFQM